MFRSKKLKKFKDISHCFFSRKGGFSKGIYKSLNCGKGSRDKKNNINKNLKLVLRKINSKKLLLMHQTHSNKVIVVNNSNKHLKKFPSDALVTKLKGLTLGVVTADCVPIILFDAQNKIIGCIHAGWKGAFAGIIENTVKKFRILSRNNKIFASVGPCIGKKSYEVDLIFYERFISKSKKNKIYFKTNNKKKDKKFFDLRKYVNDKLIKLKIKTDHINRDTYSEKSNFFSYRRSQLLGENDYGRCISLIHLSNFSQNY